MELEIRKATKQDLAAVVQLYETLLEHLEAGTNYPGWRKDIYPTQQDAEAALNKGQLYVAQSGDALAGTIVLNHLQEEAYQTMPWGCNAAPEKVMVLHTFAVHPVFGGKGVGTALMQFAEAKAKADGLQTIRLDVYENNKPAIRLYEKQQFHHVGTADMGYGMYGLHEYRLYEKIL